MRILFVVGHPAHVHLFRNAITELMDRGHHVQIAAVDKESTLMLLAAYNLQYVVFGRNDPNMGLKILDTPRKDYRFLRLLRESATENCVQRHGDCGGSPQGDAAFYGCRVHSFGIFKRSWIQACEICGLQGTCVSSSISFYATGKRTRSDWR